MPKTYADKLKDPRWQKKRLEIFERDNWTCRYCGTTQKTLHIHHEKYTGEPWEAKSDDLKTVCHICHDVIEINKKFSWETLHIEVLDEIINSFVTTPKEGLGVSVFKFENRNITFLVAFHIGAIKRFLSILNSF